MPDPALRRTLAGGGFILAPGVYDLISALMADNAGFPALYMTGFGVSASHLGLPDAGLATFTDMVSRVATIAERTRTPLVADGDTGYGGLLNVRHAVRGFEAAGASAIQIEDQVFPKKCGHTPGRQVVPLPEMLRKLQVALEARRSEDFLIIARTDSRTGLGLDEALRRAEAFAAVGADLVFVESPESVDELRLIAERVDAPLVANMVQGGLTPVLGRDELQALGYSLAIHPAAGFLAAAAAMARSYGELRDTGQIRQSELHEFNGFCRVMGFEDVWEFDRRWSDDQPEAAE